jgi:uncharacterized protein involved in outer membrane biogenesis
VKKLSIGVAALAGLCVVALIIASFSLGSIVKAGVNDYAPKLTGTRVSVSGATISPLSGSGTLRGFVVGNPKGWSGANLASLGSLHLSVAPKSLFGDHVVINDIEINAPEFDYETKIVSSNVGDLLANIEHATGMSAKTKSGKPIKFEVKHFAVRNGRVRLGAGKAALSIPLPPLELSDLGTSQGGITSVELATAVMHALTDDIVSAATHAAIQAGGTSGAAAAQAVNDARAKLKGIFGGKK